MLKSHRIMSQASSQITITLSRVWLTLFYTWSVLFGMLRNKSIRLLLYTWSLPKHLLFYQCGMETSSHLVKKAQHLWIYKLMFVFWKSSLKILLDFWMSQFLINIITPIKNHKKFKLLESTQFINCLKIIVFKTLFQTSESP